MATVAPKTKELGLIFVGGAPRSGTTLLQKLLNRHSGIYGGPEFDLIPLLMPALMHLQKAASNGRLAAYASANRAEEFSRNVLLELLLDRAHQEGVHTISEKTPSNILYFKTLMDLFPEARFVEVTRDPLDVLASHKKVQEKLGKPFKQLKIMKNILRHQKAAIGLIDRPNFFQVNYEELVSNPENKLRALMRFLELPFEEEQLATEHSADKILELNHQSTKAYSNKNQTKKVNTQNIEKWRQVLSFKEAKFAQYYFFKKHRLNE
jgi:hypothetical protein